MFFSIDTNLSGNLSEKKQLCIKGEKMGLEGGADYFTEAI
jgi:hypothetical protein